MPALGVSDLRFRYRRGHEELFGGLSHEFTPSRLTALTGESGRGKSTLLYILGLLLTPTGGSVQIDGRDASSRSDADRSRLRAEQIGFVFQDAELDPTRVIVDSVMEPALYAPERTANAAARARDLLERFGLGERATHRPGEISGGQAQRVAVCRALVNEPTIVLADEPTGNLDRANATVVLDALHQAASDHACTVVVATHDPYVVGQCHEVLSL